MLVILEGETVSFARGGVTSSAGYKTVMEARANSRISIEVCVPIVEGAAAMPPAGTSSRAVKECTVLVLQALDQVVDIAAVVFVHVHLEGTYKRLCMSQWYL